MRYTTFDNTSSSFVTAFGPGFAASLDLSLDDGFFGVAGAPNISLVGFANVINRDSLGGLVFGDMLFPADGQFGDLFGASVAVGSPSGAVALIGSPQHDSQEVGNAGAVYVFHAASAAGPFSLEAVLTAPQPLQSGELFGTSVALDGVTAVVGARGNNSAGADTGAAYVFERVGPGSWLFQQTLLGTSAGDLFGFAVDIEEDVIVVGAPTGDGPDPGFGATYVYRKIGSLWTLEAVLNAGDPGMNGFGFAARVSGDIAVVGAPLHDGGGFVNNGAAYVFRYAGQGMWPQDAMLLPCQTANNEQFGTAVAASAGTVLCGKSLLEESAHLFRHGAAGWHETARLLPIEQLESFGKAVSLKDNVALVGAPGDVTHPAGDAYLFVFCTGDLNENGSVGVEDFLALLASWGSSGDADLNCDGTIDVVDFLLLLANWGACANTNGLQPLSLRDEFEAAGLTSNDYSAFLNNVGDANYRCWTAHYLSTCSPTCTQGPSCSSRDPYRTGRH